MKKLLGYVLMLIGAGLIAGKLAYEKFLEKIPVISDLTQLVIIIMGIVLIIFGFLVLKVGKKVQESEEVPIYKGKEIIGYRKK